MVQWEQIRHRVALAGRVTDAQTNKAIAMAQVRISDAPEAFVASLITKAKLVALANEPTEMVQARITLDDAAASNEQKLEAAQKIIDFLVARQALTTLRPYLTQTAADGLFYFLDLPRGKYTLIASLPNFQRRYGISQVENITVSHNDRGDIAIAIADIALPSTSLTGKITHTSETNAEPLVLAEVRLEGSQESTFSDSKGEYILSGLEASVRQRTVLVRARGYKPNEGTITLSQPGEQKTLNFELTPLTKLLQRS
jgi:hypothetical protein